MGRPATRLNVTFLEMGYFTTLGAKGPIVPALRSRTFLRASLNSEATGKGMHEFVTYRIVFGIGSSA
jgi:hypothetical protein